MRKLHEWVIYYATECKATISLSLDHSFLVVTLVLEHAN